LSNDAIRLNSLGQPIGPALPDWTPPALPSREAMDGRFCRVEALDPDRHAGDLLNAIATDTDGRTFTYLPYGPFESRADYVERLRHWSASDDPLFFAIVPRETGKAAGIAAYLRITPGSGFVEVGHVYFSPLLQRTPAATEAMYLMMQRAFELGYRRYEWKCDSLNAASRAAAQRFGFSYEGVFRQATVYKGRSRDTAWYACIDSEWPALKAAYEQWLDPSNFDAAGRQRAQLGELTSAVLKARG